MELAVDIPAPVIATKFDEPLMNAARLAQSSVKEETVDMRGPSRVAVTATPDDIAVKRESLIVSELDTQKPFSLWVVKRSFHAYFQRGQAPS